MNRALRPLLAALVGGVIVAVAILVLGLGSTTTTKVVEQASLSRSRPVDQQSKGLTAGDIYQRDAPGVVNVRSTIVRQGGSPLDPFGQGPQQGQATGSGVVLDKDGHILTNFHVIDGARKVTVQFEDRKTTEASVVGTDRNNDIALLKVDPSGISLKPLELGDSSTAKVGDPVVAIGNPFGLDRTLTTGVVSALQRQISAPNGFSISHVLQTDAAINPGNSGGPLIDASGKVIGINSQIATNGGSQGNVGIGFAVPINQAKKDLPALKSGGTIKEAYLGISGASIDASLDSLNLAAKQGVLIQKVTPGTPAAKAGLRGGHSQAQVDGNPIMLGGDVIVGIDGKKVTGMDQVAGAVSSKKPGDAVTLRILRGGKTRQVTVKLAARPRNAPQG